METRASSNAVIARYDYTLLVTGHRQRVVDHTGATTTYSYDDLYRLVNETITNPILGNVVNTYTYDEVGNRTYSIQNGVHTAYTYDANDRLLTAGGETYTYDANGNTLTVAIDSELTTNTYDANNRLIHMVKQVGGSVVDDVRYEYDIDGLRVAKNDDGVATKFVLDKNRDYGQVLAELDASNQPSVTYVYGDDLISQQRAGNDSFYLYDGHGSTRALADSTGSITDTYDYDAFGSLLDTTGTTENSYRYTSEQFDASLGQYYLRARYYDPSIGRFTQMDSWLGSASDPVTLHKYAYGNLDPINHTDPSGHFGLMEFGAANSIATELTLMQVNAGISLLDFSLTGNVEMPSASSLGIAAVSAIAPIAGFKILKLLSNKFRQACNSFTEETPVLTDSGPKAISDLAIGDKVWAFNDDTGQLELQEVVHFIERSGTYTLVHLTTESGEVLSATEGHPFYVKTAHGWQWIEAGEITKGAIVRDRDGNEQHIVALETSEFQGIVYNLTVANDHTYFVGDDRVLAHNATVCTPLFWSSRSADKLFYGVVEGGKAKGFHHRPGGLDPDSARLIRKSTVVDSGKWTGAYKAKVEICESGQCYKKTDESTFFPDSWSRSRVQNEVTSAYNNALVSFGGKVPPGGFVSKSSNGYPIFIVTKPDGELVTAYPHF